MPRTEPPGARAGDPHTPRLAGRVAFITGAGGGIGGAVALRYAREGAAVLLADLDEPAIAATARRISAQGGRALTCPVDVTDETAVRDAVARGLAHFGRIDLLFNGAGGSLKDDGPVDRLDLGTWQRTLRLDLEGTMLCCRHVIPAIAAAGGGTVVNMSSGAGLRGTFNGHAYTAAKGAVIALTRALAGTYGPAGIRVNAICAGRIRTPRILRQEDAGSAMPAALAAAMEARYPYREGEPEDIAAIALFLASADSRMITGEAIAANGGFSAF